MIFDPVCIVMGTHCGSYDGQNFMLELIGDHRKCIFVIFGSVRFVLEHSVEIRGVGGS